jgi:hypothetical protein
VKRVRLASTSPSDEGDFFCSPCPQRIPFESEAIVCPLNFASWSCTLAFGHYSSNLAIPPLDSKTDFILVKGGHVMITWKRMHIYQSSPAGGLGLYF